jgi:protein-disulfide isomerase
MAPVSPALHPPLDPALDHALGPVDAPVTLIEYGDFECPYCGAAHPALRELRRRMGDGLRFAFRHLPVVERHPHAQEAAEAAEAAGEQGRFWEMHDLLFENQRALAPDDLRGHARDLGLDLERFDAALADHRHRARVERDVESAARSGVGGTPAFFLDGERYEGFYDAESLEDAVRSAAGR